MTEQTSPVLIVGAGPVGLGCALELARFGVPSLVIEKRAGLSWHPKTRSFNGRTMEIARGWGAAVYKRLRSIDTPDGWKSPIRFLSSAIGEEFGQIDSVGFAGAGPTISPALSVMSSQDLIEQILLDAAMATGLVTVRFQTEGLRLQAGSDPSDTAAVLEIRDLVTGAQELLTGPALIGADGSASLIRDELGVEMVGAKNLAHLVNCYFRADIESRLKGRKGVLLFVSNAAARGVLQPLDAAGRWLCQITVKAEEWDPEVFTPARAAEWIRAAAGVDDLELEVLSLGFWRLNATVAERFVHGRVLLCGDAAHQFPPTGGLGVNTGLQGMHNAMWKLALCVKGQAGWPLLSTYDDERHGVSVEITQQSLENSNNVGRIQAAAISGADSGLSAAEVVTASRRYGNHLGVEFGAAYRSAAVIADGTQPPEVADSYSDYVQSASPGCRAPHLWLGRPDAHLSTFDLFGGGFTLLAGPGGEAWCAQAKVAAAALEVQIDPYRVGAAGLRDDGSFIEAYGIEADGAVLVRPDGYVGWRGVSAPTAPDELLAVLTQILSRDEVTTAPCPDRIRSVHDERPG